MRLRILFAFYPLVIRYNHGIALLSALCKKAGIETSLYLLDEVSKFRECLLNSCPDLVGFSCVGRGDFEQSLPFMQVAREMGCTVILGGVYPRHIKDIKSPAHWVCYGEGEFLPELIIEKGWLDHPPAEEYLCPDLNILPLPDYELFKEIPYNRDFPPFRGKKILPYHASRGCPFNCSFCHIQSQPRRLRVRTKAEEDLREITGRYKPDIIYINDELLPYYRPGWKESWGDFRIPFIANIRGDIAPDHLDWLQDRGMVGCMFGIEAGNEQYRNEVLNKDLEDAHIWRTIEALKKYGISYGTFFMIGTPGETFKLRLETHKMAEKILEGGGYILTSQFVDFKAIG